MSPYFEYELAATDAALAALERKRMSPPDEREVEYRTPFEALSIAQQMDEVGDWLMLHPEDKDDAFDALDGVIGETLVDNIGMLNNEQLGAWLRQIVLDYYGQRIQEAWNIDDEGEAERIGTLTE